MAFNLIKGGFPDVPVAGNATPSVQHVSVPMYQDQPNITAPKTLHMTLGRRWALNWTAAAAVTADLPSATAAEETLLTQRLQRDWTADRDQATYVGLSHNDNFDAVLEAAICCHSTGVISPSTALFALAQQRLLKVFVPVANLDGTRLCGSFATQQGTALACMHRKPCPAGRCCA